jgi:hypothetical protein
LGWWKAELVALSPVSSRRVVTPLRSMMPSLHQPVHVVVRALLRRHRRDSLAVPITTMDSSPERAWAPSAVQVVARARGRERVAWRHRAACGRRPEGAHDQRAQRMGLTGVERGQVMVDLR